MTKNNYLSFASKLYRRERLIVSFFMCIIVLSMSVGYALYQSEIEAIGTIAIAKTDLLVLENVEKTESQGVSINDISFSTDRENNVVTLSSRFFTTFNTGNDNYIKLKYTIKNNVNNNWYLTSFTDSKIGDVSLKEPRIIGLDYEEAILPNETREVLVIYYIEGNNDEEFNLEILPTFTFSTNMPSSKKGSLLVNLTDNSFDMGTNRIVSTAMNVLNNHFFSVKYSLSLNNENILLVDKDGIEKDYTNILYSSEDYEKDIYFKIKDDIELPQSTNVILTTEDGTIYNLDKITISESEPEPIGPSISNLVFDYTLEAQPSWEDHYYLSIQITNNNDFQIDEWTAYFKIAESVQLEEVQNWNDSYEIDYENRILTLSSKYRYTESHHSIAANGGVYNNQEKFILWMLGEEFVVESITMDCVYNGETHTGLIVK